QNIAEDKPLVLTEFGVDSLREGADRQAELLSWMIRAGFESGVAGTFVFSWTDDWFTGGAQIADWAFGRVDADRQPKPAYRGAQAATGGIVAYTDSDCVPDPDWLAFLVYKFVRSGFVAVGGPNFPPPEPYLVPAAVAASPGGPTHVLLNDEVAEHVPGCNMAFTKKALEEIGGFE